MDIPVAGLVEFRQKFRNLNCKRYMQPEILSRHSQHFNTFYDLNNCWHLKNEVLDIFLLINFEKLQ
jgi:hypothetical protein